ncbi:AMP-dependent synthetase/ligase [Nesterenkonia alba]|uniref:AMP-dependent synthetase/ligase n=1 Tax=Nesterenkonia alba TaxID=515814 RepID=UPI0003B4D079|nr:AMP-dependent synthetase/ligase [Nesterenkonia alba]
MREISTPPAVEVDPDTNITDLLADQANQDPDNILYTVQQRPGQWEDITAGEFRDDVVRVAKGLIATGVAPGDRVAIMSATRYEWALIDFAIWYAGAISVPIYETSSPSQIAWILSDSGARTVIVEKDAHRQSVLEAIDRENITGVEDIFSITGGDLGTLRTAGAEVDDAEVASRRSAAGLKDLATLIYTSGTTGRPKGCELTHGNFAEHCLQTLAAVDGIIGKDSSTVLFLPMAHVFARFVSVIFVAAGGRVAHTSDIKQLVDDLGVIRPTFLLGVPRVFEKIYNGAALKAEAEGKGRIFASAANAAIDWSRATAEGSVPLRLRAKHAIFARLVYSKLHKRMGGNVTHAFSGGSLLGERLGHFFHGIGIQIIEGYGLTETTAPVAGNLPELYRIGTVGTPLPGNAVRIDDDGEILVRGTCVFRGYFNNEQANAESFVEADDGGEPWFRTGDLGELDEVGRLRITGRKKEILVTAAGKNVSPAQLEDAIRADILVSQAVVVGEGRPFVAAMLTLDSEAIGGWCERHGIDPQTPMEQLVEHPAIVEHLQGVIDDVNQSVSQAESIREFTVLAEDFTIDSGHLTPSLKIRREEIMRDFHTVVDRLYARATAARERASAARDRLVKEIHDRRHQER